MYSMTFILLGDDGINHDNHQHCHDQGVAFDIVELARVCSLMNFVFFFIFNIEIIGK